MVATTKKIRAVYALIRDGVRLAERGHLAEAKQTWMLAIRRDASSKPAKLCLNLFDSYATAAATGIKMPVPDFRMHLLKRGYSLRPEPEDSGPLTKSRREDNKAGDKETVLSGSILGSPAAKPAAKTPATKTPARKPRYAAAMPPPYARKAAQQKAQKHPSAKRPDKIAREKTKISESSDPWADLADEIKEVPEENWKIPAEKRNKPPTPPRIWPPKKKEITGEKAPRYQMPRSSGKVARPPSGSSHRTSRRPSSSPSRPKTPTPKPHPSKRRAAPSGPPARPLQQADPRERRPKDLPAFDDAKTTVAEKETVLGPGEPHPDLRMGSSFGAPVSAVMSPFPDLPPEPETQGDSFNPPEQAKQNDSVGPPEPIERNDAFSIEPESEVLELDEGVFELGPDELTDSFAMLGDSEAKVESLVDFRPSSPSGPPLHQVFAENRREFFPGDVPAEVALSVDFDDPDLPEPLDDPFGILRLQRDRAIASGARVAPHPPVDSRVGLRPLPQDSFDPFAGTESAVSNIPGRSPASAAAAPAQQTAGTGGFPVFQMDEAITMDTGVHPDPSEIHVEYDVYRDETGSIVGAEELKRAAKRQAESEGEDAETFDRHALMERARQHHDLGDFARAHKLLQQLLAVLPNDAEAKDLYERSCARIEARRMSRLRSLDAIPRLAKDQEELLWHSLDAKSAFVMTHVDGIQSIRKLLKVIRLPEQETVKILANLVENGVLAVD